MSKRAPRPGDDPSKRETERDQREENSGGGHNWRLFSGWLATGLVVIGEKRGRERDVWARVAF